MIQQNRLYTCQFGSNEDKKKRKTGIIVKILDTRVENGITHYLVEAVHDTSILGIAIEPNNSIKKCSDDLYAANEIRLARADTVYRKRVLRELGYMRNEC